MAKDRSCYGCTLRLGDAYYATSIEGLNLCSTCMTLVQLGMHPTLRFGEDGMVEDIAQIEQVIRMSQ